MSFMNVCVYAHTTRKEALIILKIVGCLCYILNPCNNLIDFQIELTFRLGSFCFD